MDGSPIHFSSQQQTAISAVDAWLKHDTKDKQVFRLFGFAGTGKTTIARHLAEGLNGSTVYAAFTGKAALMMRRNGCVGASTIHSLIYKTVEHGDGLVTFEWNPDSEAADADLIVIDECSMVGNELALDLLRFGKPVLVLGDPAQLPPVKDGGYFTDAKPDVMLTEIHRQARDNPIIALATSVRQGEVLGYGTYGESRIVRRGVLSDDEVVGADQLLVGKNDTRKAFNAKIRKILGRASVMPEIGDRLVCLRNDKAVGIFNGGIFEVTEVPKRRKRKDFIRLRVQSEDFPNRAALMVQVRREFFFGGLDNLDWRELRNSQQFDFGYALTTHKAQGSQWSNVIVYDESAVFREDARKWLYTAITRAADTLTIVR